jgi:ubiquinone/menaquinone biosynthesis C-methylase UbiE
MAAEPIAGDGAICDVGCGSGWLLDAMAESGVAEERLHGVDLLPARVDAAAARLPGADIRRADARTLPYGDGELALVTMFTVLSSMPNREAVRQALAETRRVLAEDGLVLVYEPALPNPLNRATRLVSRAELERELGPFARCRRLTGLPPAARRLGRRTSRLYPMLSRVAPSHRLTAQCPGQRPKRRE